MDILKKKKKEKRKTSLSVSILLNLNHGGSTETFQGLQYYSLVLGFCL